MKTMKIFAAFMAAFLLLMAAGCDSARQEASLGSNAQGLTLQPINSGGDFGVASVVETAGSSTVYLYGGSSRAGLLHTEFGVLTTTDGFATAPSWQAMSGVVGYGMPSPQQVNSAIITCPIGQTCGGKKAFYILSNPGRLYGCSGLSGVKDLSGCAPLAVTGMTAIDSRGIGLDQTGNSLIVGAYKTGDARAQLYSIAIAAGTATKLPCSDPAQDTYPTGGVVGEGANSYLYVWYNTAHYRYSWNGTTCTGSRIKVGAAMGWDNGVDDPANEDYYAAVGKTTGTFYFSRAEGDFYLSKKDRSCNNDSFISGGEVCDPSSSTPLNGQSCTTIGAGFSSGTLACNPATCEWNTSACVMPGMDCGNAVINPGEECDGTNLGGKTCASENGVGWTGTLSCSGTCSLVKTACVPPPSCGDGVCNGIENCTSCAGDCGTCPVGVCGDGVVNSGEECDGSVMAGATCDAVKKSVGWSGAVKCTACKLDATSCNFGWGIKNLTGACTLGGEGAAQSVNFSGGNCSAEYWPIDALKAIKVSWAASAGKAILLAVAAGNLKVNVPEGVSHQEIDDNGVWKYDLAWNSGFSAGAEGTKYSAVEKVFPIIAFGCKEGSIRLRMNGTPVAAINVDDGSPGRLPAGYGAEVNVLTGTVTNGPYKLDSIPAGDGGVEPDGGITLPPDANVGSDAGVNPPGGGGGGGEGCSCSVPPAEGGFSASFLAALVGLTVLVRRRRN
jgi:MYXO-CTERM domain-containing protein